MHKLHKFFEAKIATQLKYRVMTGKEFFTEIYERYYLLEIVVIDDVGVDLLVTSFDVKPSGAKAGSSDKGFGTVTVPFGDSIEAMLKSAIVEADPTFFKRYPDVVGQAA